MRYKSSMFMTLALMILVNAASAQQVEKLLRPLKQLIGTWEMNTPDGKVIEVWTYFSPEKLSGKSYQISSNNDSTLLEEAEILVKDNNLHFIPIVSGQNDGRPVVFALKSKAGGVYVFENTAHDFPQRVCYQLQSGGKLLAWVEGKKNEKFIKTEFKYIRADLP